MKENGWVVGVWEFEPFSHGNHHIRVYMHHVCLIQSISARKANHIKLGTRSGSSQFQLHFGTKKVSIGWSGCEWLPSECNNAHFQAFPPLAPSGIIRPYCKQFWKYRFLTQNGPDSPQNHPSVPILFQYNLSILFKSLVAHEGHCWGVNCLKRQKNGKNGKFCNRIIRLRVKYDTAYLRIRRMTHPWYIYMVVANPTYLWNLPTTLWRTSYTLSSDSVCTCQLHQLRSDVGICIHVPAMTYLRNVPTTLWRTSYTLSLEYVCTY